MAARYILLNLKLVFLIVVFISCVEYTISSFVEGNGDDQPFDFSVEDATENHFTYSDMSHG